MKLFKRRSKHPNLWSSHNKAHLSIQDAAMLNFEMAESKIEDAVGEITVSSGLIPSHLVEPETEVEYQMDNFKFDEKVSKTEVQEKLSFAKGDIDSVLRSSGWTDKQIRELKVAKIYLEEII